jgi:opacity protein-like surface antigen
VQGFAMTGLTWFTATETFDAVLDTTTGVMFGGGLRVTIPGGPYLEVGAWRFRQDGERVFVAAGGEVFRLGIPATVTMTPLEVTAGWRFRGLLGRRVTPYLGAGYTSMRYEETSAFADSGENVSDRFSGYHVTGGAEVHLHRWVALSGDIMWTAVPDAIGGGGASQVFEEDDLGGTSLRLRLVIGR